MQRALALFVFLFVCAPSAAWAQTAQCTPDNAASLRATVARLVGALKVAQYRADAALLESNSSNLDTLLASCGEAMKVQLCDAECQYQRASVRLFKATGLPLLSSRGSTSPGGGVVPPGELLAYASDGILIVEEGIRKLPRQQVVGTPEEQKTKGFNAYVKSLALLTGLKARLLVAAGDTWYRAASVSQVMRLAYLTGEAVGDDAPASGFDDEYSKALTYYDEAFWTVMEARGSLPPSDLFVAERSTVAGLERDIGLRLSSVRKGQLYIGIDPDDMTVEGIDKLGRQLVTQRQELRNKEDLIAGLLTQWAERYKDLGDKQFDVTNMAHARAIDNEVYKIARLEDQASLLKNGIQTRIDAVRSAQSTFERESQIRVLQAGLARRKAELQNEIQSIQAQKVQDLLALDKEQTRDALDQYRFNIDMALAAYNFQMQLDSLDLQIKELENRIGNDEKDIGIAQRRADELDVDVALENKRIAGAGILIAKYRAEQSTVFASQQASIQADIAATDAELAWLGTDAAHLNAVCSARQALSQLTDAEIAKVKACYESSCPGSEGLKTTIENLRTKNEQVLTVQRQTAEKQLNLLRLRAVELGVALVAWRVTKNLEAAANVLSLAAGVAAAVPKVEVGLTGPFPTEIVDATSGLGESAKVAADFASHMVSWAQTDIQFMNQLAGEVNAVAEQATQLQGQIDQLDVEKMVNHWNTQKALAEVNVQLVTLTREQAENGAERVVQQVQCNRDAGQIVGTVNKLTATRASLVAQLQAKTQEAALLDYDIEQQQNLRGQSEIAIRRIGVEKSQIALEISKIQQDADNLRGMKRAIVAQMGRVQGFQSKVNGYVVAYDAKLAVLKNVQDKIRAGTIAISGAQAAYVSSVIDSESSATASEISDVKQQIALLGAEQSLNAQMTEVEATYRSAILENRQNILDLAKNAPTNDQAIAIFWDFEELAAELTRGAAEILEEKRALLQNINYTYNFYRNRYDMLTTFAEGVRPIGANAPFIRTAADVTNALGNCSAFGGIGSSEICNPDSLAWSKSTVTGSSSEFVLEQNSGLLSQLQKDGRVVFEVSPFASVRSGGAVAGNFTLWDDANMHEDRSMPLINVVVGVQGSSCRAQQIKVRHLGFGVQFERLSENSTEVLPTLVSKAPTDATLPVYGDNETGMMTAEYTKFRDGAYTAIRLEQKVQDSASVYPFMGYPVIGSYELIADQQLLACLASGAPALKLGLVYAVK